MVPNADETTASTSDAIKDVFRSMQYRILEDDGELDAAIECAGELEIAVQCVDADATTCGGCIDTSNFAERFTVDAENEFRKQLAFTPAAEPGFCFEADARMCAYHDTIIVRTLSCCDMDFLVHRCIVPLIAHIPMYIDTILRISRIAVVKKRPWHFYNARGIESILPNLVF